MAFKKGHNIQKIRILSLAFLLGFLWVYWHAKGVIEQKIPSFLVGKTLRAIGVISKVPEWHDGDLLLDFNIQNVFPQRLWPNPGKVRIHWGDAPATVSVGDKWQLSLKLKQPHGLSNPGSFDKEQYFFQNRIVAEGSVVSSRYIRLLKSSPFSHPVDRIRAAISKHISKVLKEKPFSGVMTALVVGIQNGISVEQWKIFRNTGTAHLLAISGLHIGLSASFMHFLVYFLWRFLPIYPLSLPLSLVSASLGLSIAIIYALLAGFSVPTQRAVVMIAVFVVALLSKRVISVWRGYCLALGFVLLLDPLSTLSPGFWLSFSAVGILLYGMRSRLSPKGFWWRWGQAQWVIFLGLTPITLILFGMGSLVSPLANMIAIPWVSFLVVPLCLAGTLILCFSETLGGLLLKMADFLMTVLWPLLEFLSQYPILNGSFGAKPLWILLLSLLGILCCLLPKGFPGKLLGAFWILPLFLCKHMSIEPNSAKVTVLDVGQGLATVVRTQNHILVFDTGPKLGDMADAGERVVLPYLATEGIAEIDMLVISHGDNDHSGGAKAILDSIPVKQILTSEPNLFSHPITRMCKAGQHWEWDGVRFDILHPKFLFYKKRNDHSCVLRVAAGDQSVLLTADIETPSEESIITFSLQGSQSLQSTVLLVPHHGSRTSSSIPFLQAVNPTYAIVPVGYQNSYGHPKADVLLRYQNQNIKTLDTSKDGAVSFLLSHDRTMQFPSCFRRKNQRYWHFQGSLQ